MAAKTFFIVDAAVNGFGSLSETDPGASTTGTGWGVAKIGSGNFSALLYGTERASGTFSTTDYLVTTHPNPGSGDSWRSENPISGDFASANWTFTFNVRAVTGAGTQRGRVKFRMWRSANADGSSPTEITAATQSCSIIAGISTTVDNASSLTFNPGAFTLNGEYLFIQCEWEITTAGDNNNRDILFRASSSTIVTSEFTPAVIPWGETFDMGRAVVPPFNASEQQYEAFPPAEPVIPPTPFGAARQIGNQAQRRVGVAAQPFVGDVFYPTTSIPPMLEELGLIVQRGAVAQFFGGDVTQVTAEVAAQPGIPIDMEYVQRRITIAQQFSADVLGPVSAPAPVAGKAITPDRFSMTRKARVIE